MSRKLADTVYGPGIEPVGAVWLGLHSYTDVFYGAGDYGVGDPGEGSGGVVLAVRKSRVQVVGRGVGGFEAPAGVVECSELD